MSDPEITVITCTYNRPDMLARAIASVRAQTFTDWEMVLVNDGGQTPHHPDDPRIRLFDRAHEGAVHAFNFAFQQARGRYICFLDDDDIYYPFNLLVKHDAIRRYGTAIVYTPCYINTNGVLTRFGGGEWTIAGLLKGCFMANLGVIFRRELLEQVGLFDPEMWVFHDWEWQLRACQLGVTNAFHDCAPVGEYTIHPQSIIRAELVAGRRLELERMAERIRRRYAGL